MKVPVALGILSLLGCHAGPACSEWIADAETGFVHDGNLSHGQLRQDIKGDTALEVAASAGQRLVLGDYSGLSLTGNLKSAAYNRYHGLNHLDLGMALAFKTKLGLGPAAPWWRATGSATRLKYQNDLRDGWLYTVGSAVGKRVGESWNVRGDFVYERRTADQNIGVAPGISGAVFDQRSHSIQANADYAYSEAIAISAGYTRRVGDVVATTQRNYEIFEYSTAVASDPVFGSDTFAYKLRAVTHVFFIGASRALNAHSSLNLGFERQISHGTGDNNYYSSVVRLALAYSF